MAAKQIQAIQFDVETREWEDKTTDREYSELECIMIQKQETGRGHSYTEAVNLTVYVDEQTGVMVNDPLKFETWLKANRLA